MDLNSETSSDEEDGAIVHDAEVSLSGVATWRRRSRRPQRSAEIYEAKPAPKPRLLQAAVRAADEVTGKGLRVINVPLGSLIKVFWPGERRWFLGLVGKTREDRYGKQVHHISYQDGDTKWHHLPSVRWLQVQSTDEAEVEVEVEAEVEVEVEVEVEMEEGQRQGEGQRQEAEGQAPAAEEDDDDDNVEQEEAEAEGLTDLHISARTSTGYRGVTYDAKKRRKAFRAMNGRVSLGYFATAVEAAKCYARHVQSQQDEWLRDERTVHVEEGQEESMDEATPPPQREGAGAAVATEAAVAEEDWTELEVGLEELAEKHLPIAVLAGSDVCVLPAAFPGFELKTPGAIGWRGEVTRRRGGGKVAVQVQVFGSWFELLDRRRICAIEQVEDEGDEEEKQDEEDGEESEEEDGPWEPRMKAAQSTHSWWFPKVQTKATKREEFSGSSRGTPLGSVIRLRKLPRCHAHRADLQGQLATVISKDKSWILVRVDGIGGTQTNLNVRGDHYTLVHGPVVATELVGGEQDFKRKMEPASDDADGAERHAKQRANEAASSSAVEQEAKVQRRMDEAAIARRSELRLQAEQGQSACSLGNMQVAALAAEGGEVRIPATPAAPPTEPAEPTTPAVDTLMDQADASKVADAERQRATPAGGSDVGKLIDSRARLPHMRGMASMDEVKSILKSWNLSQYADTFLEQGYDDLAYLKGLGEDALQRVANSVGMKPGHAGKFVMYMMSTAADYCTSPHFE